MVFENVSPSPSMLLGGNPICIGQKKIECQDFDVNEEDILIILCIFSVWCIDAIYMEIAHTNVIALHHISCVFF